MKMFGVLLRSIWAMVAVMALVGVCIGALARDPGTVRFAFGFFAGGMLTAPVVALWMAWPHRGEEL